MDNIADNYNNKIIKCYHHDSNTIYELIKNDTGDIMLILIATVKEQL